MTQPLILTFYRSGLSRRWRWRLVHHANGAKIAREAQGLGFSRLEDCQHNAVLTLAGMHTRSGMPGLIYQDGRLTGIGPRPDVEIRYGT